MEDSPKHRTQTVVLPQCKLVVVKGPQRGREHVLTADVIRVGKANDNDLVLPEETVSRVHLEILRDGKGYLLRDLHSTNGTFLDGAEIREAYIRAGSIITVGNVQLRFQPVEERTEVPPWDGDVWGEMYGAAPAMRSLFGVLEHVAPTGVSVLLEGEAGTGKELAARTIHARSRRSGGPFVVVDGSNPSATALESVLFGHDKGAGHATARQGAFELAHGGTLYLARVDELGLDLQTRLVRVLEQREVRRAGGTKGIKVDVRVVAGSERDLRREVDRGKIREELYFRLSTVVVRVPPLRERAGDVPGLAAQLLEARGADALAVDEAQLAGLRGHDWPGNVRELKQVLERGLRLGGAAGETLGDDAGARPSDGDGEFDPERSYRENKERFEHAFERRYLRWLLTRAEGNISRAAREADMDRKYLHRLLKKHQIVV